MKHIETNASNTIRNEKNILVLIFGFLMRVVIEYQYYIVSIFLIIVVVLGLYLKDKPFDFSTLKNESPCVKSMIENNIKSGELVTYDNVITFGKECSKQELIKSQKIEFNKVNSN